jgi:hypothetical protein
MRSTPYWEVVHGSVYQRGGCDRGVRDAIIVPGPARSGGNSRLKVVVEMNNNFNNNNNLNNANLNNNNNFNNNNVNLNNNNNR